MLHFKLARLTRISTHSVGNKYNEQELILADDPVKINEDLAGRLGDYFLGRMETVFDRYQFSHPTSLEYNEVFSYVTEIFKDVESLHDFSSQLAMHLYDKADHPNIKSGELHICFFEHCIYENEEVDAVGIFKTEEKSGFFEVNKEGERNFTILFKQGIDLSKFDKGCVVFNTAAEKGYEVIIYDRSSPGEEAKYWKDDFLGLVQQKNDFQQTNQALLIAKEYISNHANEDFELAKTDQIDLLNKSVEYFKNREEFVRDEFVEEVFQNPEMEDAFKSYDQSYREEQELPPPTSFDISAPAVKKQARIFKSVLKLDKNFHIYIHGNRKMIERGVDEGGRKFYKIYYEEER